MKNELQSWDRAQPRSGSAVGRFRSTLRTLVLLAAGLWLAVTGGAAPDGLDGTGRLLDPATFRPDRILVRFKSNVTAPMCAGFQERHQLKRRHRYAGLANCEALDLPPGATVPAMLDLLGNSDLVEAVEPDYWVRPFLSPNDPNYINGTQWNLHNTGQDRGSPDADIDAPEAWSLLHDTPGVIVAVIDSGIRATHEDLEANLWVNPGETGFDRFGRDKATNRVDDDGNGYVDDVHGIDTILNTGDPNDPDGHGTHVSGIIGAVGNNRIGVTGVAWKVKLMACRFLEDRVGGSISDAIACIEYARANGARVINASWGNQNYSLFLESAIRRCRDQGIVIVAAAGNEAVDNDSTPSYPASLNLDNVIAVTSTTRTDSFSSAGNFGVASVDLAAPGESIYSTYNRSDSSYAFLSGTSMAVPHVAGAVALVKARFPDETHVQSISRILATTDRLPVLKGKCVSGGRLNLAAALSTPVVAGFVADRVSGSPPLTVAFTNRSFGNRVQFAWNFGDGSPRSTETDPRHVYDREGTFQVTLLVTDADGNQSRRDLSILVASNYTQQSEPFVWTDPSAMRALVLSDDGVSPPQPLPFDFIYYGHRYSEIYVGANALIGFLPFGLDTPYNSDLPNPAAPNAILCPWWDDLNPAAGGEIRIGTTGVAPRRSVVVSWIGVPPRGRLFYAFTFQAELQEGSGQIIFRYLNVQPSRSRGAGRTAAVGIENSTGQVASKFSYGGSTLLQNNQAIRWVPPVLGGLLVKSSGPLDFTGDATGLVTPEHRTLPLQNTSDQPLNWAIQADASWILLPNQRGRLDPGMETTVTVSLSSAAAALSAGEYSGTLEFLNLETGNGDTSLPVTLRVHGNGAVLDLVPPARLSASGFVGGPFNPSSGEYQLVNSGNALLNWTADTDADWAAVDPPGGSLAAGGKTSVTITLTENAAMLPDGTYATRAVFRNSVDGLGMTDREILLTVISPAAQLAVAPPDGVALTGSLPGASGSLQTQVELSNPSEASLEWHAVSSQLWVTLDPEGGRLESGATIPVTVQINENASLLEPGRHVSQISFSSTGHAATAPLQVTLTLEHSLILSAELIDGPTGTLHLKLQGEPLSEIWIERSTDLIQWEPVQSVVIPALGMSLIQDSVPAGSATRFYRAVPLVPPQ